MCNLMLPRLLTRLRRAWQARLTGWACSLALVSTFADSLPNLFAAGYPTPTIVSNINNAITWQPAHAYSFGSTVVFGTPLRGYRAISGGTSGSSGPLGTDSMISDGSVTWKYLSDVDFQSIEAWLASIPKLSPNTCTRHYIAMQAGYVGLLWNGGEYFTRSGFIFTDHSAHGLTCNSEESPANFWDPSRTFVPFIELTTAPGESFRDKGSTSPLVYNPTNGVAIHTDA